MSRSASNNPVSPTLPAATAPTTLAGLRAEIDRLDDAIHDLLMARADVVARVGAEGGKGRVALRPGREADIIRRLLTRNRSPFPASAVVRVWRELLAATTSIQGPYAVSVAEAEPGSGFAQCAREHFGALTPLRVHCSAAGAMAEVREGTATVAVLPVPVEGEEAPWWATLWRRDEPSLHVVARLPFWAPRTAGAPRAEALVVASVAPDASAADRSLLAVAAVPGQDRMAPAAALAAAGFTLRSIILNDEAALADVAGYVTADDPRLAALHRPVMLGAYAIPVERDTP
jgi:chorismate mutase